MYLYRKTYYTPADFDDSRYDPCFSPLVYPGQTLHGSAFLPEYSQEAQVSLYVRDAHSGQIYEGVRQEITKGEWKTLAFQIPALPDESLYPRPFLFTIYVFVGALVLAALCSLIVAAVREHAGF